jgi:hypothetical protein
MSQKDTENTLPVLTVQKCHFSRYRFCPLQVSRPPASPVKDRKSGLVSLQQKPQARTVWGIHGGRRRPQTAPSVGGPPPKAVRLVGGVCVRVCVGGKRSQAISLEDLPDEPCHLHLIRRHSRERRGDLHKVPSPGAL